MKMKRARVWKMWAIKHHMPTDLFEAKRDAIYFKKAWNKPGEIVYVEVRELKRKRKDGR